MALAEEQWIIKRLPSAQPLPLSDTDGTKEIACAAPGFVISGGNMRSAIQVATIFFDVPLAGNAVNEREARYKSGVEFVQRRCPAVEIVQELPATYTLIVRGNGREIRSMRDALLKKRLGAVSVDDPDRPVFRGAVR